jgi:hypothetical protein
MAAQGFGKRGVASLGSSSTSRPTAAPASIYRRTTIFAGIVVACTLLVAGVVGNNTPPPPTPSAGASEVLQPTPSGTGAQASAAPAYPVVTPMTICKERYKLDYSMRDACIRSQEEAKVEAEAMQIDDDVKSLCARRYIHDWTMYASCARTQMAAKLPLNQKPDRPRFDIARKCQESWPGDYRMEENCIRKQEDARAKVGGWIDHRIAVGCTDQWPSDWHMFMYCVDNQTAARNRIR